MTSFNFATPTDYVLDEVALELERAQEKFGVQNHDDLRWHAILGEEVGEVAKEVVESTFGHDTASALRSELIQVAAMATAWIEAIDRR